MSAPPTSGGELQQVADLRAEGDELHALLAPLADADWARPTGFKGWTVNDIVQHLHATDLMGAASATDPAAFAALRADIQARRAAGLTRVEETRQRIGLTGRALLERWRTQLAALCGLLAAKDPDARLKWAGPDMGVRMFATARQMETWAHAQAIWDLLGRERPRADRLRNIAVIGVRTFGWTFANRGLPVPPEPPYVRLAAPSGAVWEWNERTAASRVEGDAFAFCQVVAQTRNVADTALTVEGETAGAWMRIAQCFAGPPEDPPPPGARHSSIA